MASIHMKNLADICRVCGERLQKSNQAVTSKFLCMKWKDFLAEKFEIVVEKDLEEIHQQYFLSFMLRVFWPKNTGYSHMAYSLRW